MLRRTLNTLLVPAGGYYGSEQALTFDAMAWKVISLLLV